MWLDSLWFIRFQRRRSSLPVNLFQANLFTRQDTAIFQQWVCLRIPVCMYLAIISMVMGHLPRAEYLESNLPTNKVGRHPLRDITPMPRTATVQGITTLGIIQDVIEGTNFGFWFFWWMWGLWGILAMLWGESIVWTPSRCLNLFVLLIFLSPLVWW